MEHEKLPSHSPLREDDVRSESAYAHRFGDWSSMQYLVKFGKDGSTRSQTFYNGDSVSTRMDAVREAIIYVRENWADYPSLMADLRAYIHELTAAGSESGTADTTPYLPTVLSSRRAWRSQPTSHHAFLPDDESEDLSVIRLYTSKVGYDQIFRVINQAFRTDELTEAEQRKRLRSAVFLVELLNIDLFNYTYREPQAQNFHGTVYRGVVFSDAQLEDFKNLAARPVAERFWAIPLAMMSASTDKNVALREFASVPPSNSGSATDETGPRHPFLWRIHVIGLHAEYLRIYHERFPTSVVSSICAVPIRQLSDFAGEDEVLLRGPFFQLIGIREEAVELEPGREQRIYVMELVMLNVNRDHPSTMQLGEEKGEQARKLFGCLVGMWRAEVCKQLAAMYGLEGDVEQYNEIHRGEYAKFMKIFQ
ncbi:hypothetical protein H0H81_011362 [Sphagnurus paluster]|uniref:Uncharacterized protein n=1 Tax=Sphagnurus paluster TaxID=117069 RepID=A0A9P7GLF6_9AGAR|nr:hypothetical protein H0H81_011362 [Sphagnurus paluster]